MLAAEKVRILSPGAEFNISLVSVKGNTDAVVQDKRTGCCRSFDQDLDENIKTVVGAQRNISSLRSRCAIDINAERGIRSAGELNIR